VSTDASAEMAESGYLALMFLDAHELEVRRL
jgi:hypothetical protein